MSRIFSITLLLFLLLILSNLTSAAVNASQIMPIGQMTISANGSLASVVGIYFPASSPVIASSLNVAGIRNSVVVPSGSPVSSIRVSGIESNVDAKNALSLKSISLSGIRNTITVCSSLSPSVKNTGINNRVIYVSC